MVKKVHEKHHTFVAFATRLRPRRLSGDTQLSTERGAPTVARFCKVFP